MGNSSMSRTFSREQPNLHQVRTYCCLSVLKLGQEVPNLLSSYKNIQLGSSTGPLVLPVLLYSTTYRNIIFSIVEKWIKQNKMDFLGIPSCVGFGLHADSYRFGNK